MTLELCTKSWNMLRLYLNNTKCSLTQRKMLEYFIATREEVFFLAVRNRMRLSTIAIKERCDFHFFKVIFYSIKGYTNNAEILSDTVDSAPEMCKPA